MFVLCQMRADDDDQKINYRRHNQADLQFLNKNI